MDCPCNGCNERKLGCHSSCTKEPSYDDWKQWVEDRTEINKCAIRDNHAYLHSLEYSTQIKRRKW